MDCAGWWLVAVPAMTLELDDEDYELLGVARPYIFDEAFQIESKVSELNALPKRPRRPLTAAEKFIAAARSRARYVRRPRKPRMGPWAKRNPEKDRKRKLRWYHADPERKARIRAQQAEWRKKNPDYMKNYAKRRREKRDE